MVLRPLVVLCSGLCLSVGAAAAPPSSLPAAAPASVGLSAERLGRLTAHFEAETKREYSAGYVLMVARHGKLAYARAIGQRDVDNRLPMTLDTRFRIASMTKPVTAVAVLMLYEEGRFLLDDPVSRYLPEFANAKVFAGVEADGSLKTEPARRPITIRDLLTHTSGLGYGPGFDRSSPLAKVYAGINFSGSGTLADKVQALAGLPLYFQPGEGWRYSYAFDVLGRLVEVVSGQSFPDFLQARLFGPLKMRSTGFSIAASDRGMLATLHTHGGAATGIKRSDPPWLADPTLPPQTPSGGGGLISTAGDYLRFAQMLINGGSLDGEQLLSPTTVALMTSNQVPIDALQKYFGADSVGLGYGLGVAVEVDVRHAYHAACTGDYYWGGIFDTHWIASPRTGLVAVLLHQLDPTGNQSPPRTDYEFKNLVFAALNTPPAGGIAACTAAP